MARTTVYEKRLFAIVAAAGVAVGSFFVDAHFEVKRCRVMISWGGKNV